MLRLWFKRVPQSILRHRSSDGYQLFADRMDELDLAGVKAYSSVGIASGSSVFEVAFNGTAHGSQLAANLVMTSCF